MSNHYGFIKCARCETIFNLTSLHRSRGLDQHKCVANGRDTDILDSGISGVIMDDREDSFDVESPMNSVDNDAMDVYSSDDEENLINPVDLDNGAGGARRFSGMIMDEPARVMPMNSVDNNAMDVDSSDDEENPINPVDLDNGAGGARRFSNNAAPLNHLNPGERAIPVGHVLVAAPARVPLDVEIAEEYDEARFVKELNIVAAEANLPNVYELLIAHMVNEEVTLSLEGASKIIRTFKRLTEMNPKWIDHVPDTYQTIHNRLRKRIDEGTKGPLARPETMVSFISCISLVLLDGTTTSRSSTKF